MLLNLKNRIWNKSWINCWGGVKILVGSTTFVLASVLNDPSVRSAFDRLGLPVWAGLLIAVLGVITLIAAPHRSE